MEKLTKRQEDALKFIKTYIVSHGYPPTVREIGSMLNLNSPATTHFHLNKLEEKGYMLPSYLVPTVNVVEYLKIDLKFLEARALCEDKINKNL